MRLYKKWTRYRKLALLHQYFDLESEKTNYLLNISLSHQFLYCETPKVACSTIKKSLQVLVKPSLKEKTNIQVHNKHHSPLSSPLGLSYKDLKHCFQSADIFRFTFVRNPFSRTLSAYLEKVKNPANSALYLPKLGFAVGGEVSFMDFLKVLSQQSSQEMDKHWQPQYDLIGAAKMNYHFIGRFERFNEDFNFVLSRIAELNQQPISQMLNQRTHQRSTNKHAKNYLTGEAIDSIRQIYAKDFEYFSYSMNVQI